MSSPAIALAVLAGVAAILLAASLATAIPADSPVTGLDGYLTAWSDLHSGYDPSASAVAGPWLALIHQLARPLARVGVRPNALTCWAVLASAAVPVTAGFGRRWVLLAGLVAVIAGGLDSVDGAVAVLTGRATRFGFVLDSLADRLSDSAYVIALWVVGAPVWMCVTGGGAAGLLEYARARAGLAGLPDVGVITVWERPSRIIAISVALLGCGLLTGAAGTVATIAASAWLGLGAVGLTQLLIVVRRRLC